MPYPAACDNAGQSPTPKLSNELLDTLFTNNKVLTDLLQRLDSSVTRLRGPVHSQLGKDSAEAGLPTAPTPTFSARLSAATSEYSSCLNKLSDAISALESFV